MRPEWLARLGAIVIAGLSIIACSGDDDDSEFHLSNGESEAEGSEGESESEGGFLDQCDGNNDCEGCLACAREVGRCPEQEDACDSDGNCAAMIACFASCKKQDEDYSCYEDCYESYPGGQDEYWALVDCRYCDICPIDCGAGGC